MNYKQWRQLKVGDTVTPNRMARSDTGLVCVVQNVGRVPDLPYICIVPRDEIYFPNGYRVRFLSYKCLDLLGETDG